VGFEKIKSDTLVSSNNETIFQFNHIQTSFLARHTESNISGNRPYPKPMFLGFFALEFGTNN
jgi:hypothetical protein